MKKYLIFALIMAGVVTMVGCGGSNGESDSAAAVESSQSTQLNSDTADAKVTSTEIVLNGNAISAGDGVAVEGSTAVIGQAGSYEISGRLEDGQIIVDTAGEVQLILNAASIHCNSSSPLYIREAENVTITLKDGTVNTIEDGSAYLFADSTAEPDAALYSKADLVINGSGSLNVSANYNDGIASKDTLRIESGMISVTAVTHGIKGKDYLMINDGSIVVQAGGDGIKATNDTEASLGYVEINGGSINITATDEGISAITDVAVTNGEVEIDTANNGIKSDGSITVSGGTVTIQTDDDGLTCQEKTISAEAVVMVNGSVVTE